MTSPSTAAERAPGITSAAGPPISPSSQAELPLTVIAADSGWQWLNLRELWAYRELLYFFTWRNVKVRYKQTVLGALWAVLQPLVMMVIFTAVVGHTPEAVALPIPYPVFVFTGLLAWSMFATALSGAANSLIETERLITKIAFPRLLMPAAAIGPALIDMGVSAVVLAGLMLWYGVTPGWTAPLLVLGLAVILVAVIGAGALLAALNVMFRDFRYTTTFLLQAWMFATPAIYMAALAGSGDSGSGEGGFARWFVWINPLNGGIAFARAALFGWPLPWVWLGGAALVALVMLAVGLTYFRRTEDSFADVI